MIGDDDGAVIETASVEWNVIEDTVFVNSYELTQKLSTGQFADLYESTLVSTKRTFALKVMQKNKLLRLSKKLFSVMGEDILCEIRIWGQLRHRNIVALCEIINDPEQNDLILAMDFMKFGSWIVQTHTCELSAQSKDWNLLKRTKQSSLKRILFFVYDLIQLSHIAPLSTALSCSWGLNTSINLAEISTITRSSSFTGLSKKAPVKDEDLGLLFLHGKGVCHRDLKPENLLINHKQRLCISDFGVSRKCGRVAGGDGVFASVKEVTKLSDSSAGGEVSVESTRKYEGHVSDTVGTPAYWPPEALCSNQDNKVSYCSFKADIWAVGVIYYSALYGGIMPHLEYTCRDGAQPSEPSREPSGQPSGRWSGVDNTVVSGVEGEGHVPDQIFAPFSNTSEAPFVLPEEDVIDIDIAEDVSVSDRVCVDSIDTNVMCCVCEQTAHYASDICQLFDAVQFNALTFLHTFNFQYNEAEELQQRCCEPSWERHQSGVEEGYHSNVGLTRQCVSVEAVSPTVGIATAEGTSPCVDIAEGAAVGVTVGASVGMLAHHAQLTGLLDKLPSHRWSLEKLEQEKCFDQARALYERHDHLLL